MVERLLYYADLQKNLLLAFLRLNTARSFNKIKMAILCHDKF